MNGLPSENDALNTWSVIQSLRCSASRWAVTTDSLNPIHSLSTQTHKYLTFLSLCSSYSIAVANTRQNDNLHFMNIQVKWLLTVHATFLKGMVACVLKCTVLCMFYCYNKSQIVTNRSGEEKDAERIVHLHCETSTNRILFFHFPLFHLFEFQTTSN